MKQWYYKELHFDPDQKVDGRNNIYSEYAITIVYEEWRGKPSTVTSTRFDVIA